MGQKHWMVLMRFNEKNKIPSIAVMAVMALITLALVSACKSRRDGGRSGTGAADDEQSNHPWVTPLNLVDINASVQDATKVSLIGEVERIILDRPGDLFSSGILEVSGMRVVIPTNLLIRLPGRFSTLQELFSQASPECVAKKQTGLALADDCFFERRGATATILANRTSSGSVVAGEVGLVKGNEFVTGVVTYIDHPQGYFRLNGDPVYPASKATGVMVRMNDPTARHSIQNGLGCSGTLNCSADTRFQSDPDNYLVAFVTGYPACIPSTVAGAKRGAVVKFDSVKGLVSGTDARCPIANRPTNAATTDVADSQFFAPIKLGDSLNATGNFEHVGIGLNRAYFLSAHTIQVHAGLRTTPGKPDYLTFSETLLEVAGFSRNRARGSWLGFSTDPDSQFDLYRLAIDPTDPNEQTRQHEVALGSTVGNPGTFNLGVAPTNNHIFRVRFKDIFLTGARGTLSPCVHIANASLNGICAGGATLDASENFKVLSPATREVLARTRNKVRNPNLVSFDVSGNLAPNGEFQIPVGIEHPDFVEINLNRIQTPFQFTGQPWNLDRRLGPLGCGGDHGPCDAAAPLSPFPSDGGLDPTQQGLAGALGLPGAVAGRVVMGFPFSNITDGPLLPWESINSNNALSVSRSSPVIFSQCVVK